MSVLALRSRPFRPEAGLWAVALISALLVHLILLVLASSLYRPPLAERVYTDEILGVDLLSPQDWLPGAVGAEQAETAASQRDAVQGAADRDGPGEAAEISSFAHPPADLDLSWALPQPIAGDEQVGESVAGADEAEALLAQISRQIADRVQQVWKVPPGAPATSRVRARLELDSFGRIQARHMLEISGNSSFDESVRRALGRMEQFSQVRKLPKGLYQKHFRHLVLVFDARRTRRL